MKMKRKLLSMLLALVMCLGLAAPAFAAGSKKDGYSGEDNGMVWNFDQATGTLTISGTMHEVYYVYPAYAYYAWPWNAEGWKDEIVSVVIRDGITEIPDAYGGNQMRGAFYDCGGLTSVTIPDSVICIGAWSFYRCDSLTSVTIPDSVTKIGDGAFSHCSGLTSVTISNGVTSIGKYVFQGCTSLTSITVPDSVASIGDHAFYGCTSLTSVNLGSGVKTIGEEAFQFGPYNSGAITSITIPAGLTEIGAYAFRLNKYSTVYYGGTEEQWNELYVRYRDDNSLSCLFEAQVVFGSGERQEFVIIDGVLIEYRGLGGDIVIPGNVVRVAEDAFPQETRDSITSIIFSEGVEEIEKHAFARCSNLASVTFPASLKIIGGSAFYACGLSDVTFNRGMEQIGIQAFYVCESLTTVTFHPDSNPVLGGSAFSGCDELTSVTLPNGGSIGGYCFYGCDKLKELTIPAGVKLVEESLWGLPGDTVIYGTAGSDAEYWAVRSGLKFVDIGTVQPEQPAGGTAYASTQNILVDGKPVEFQAYALKDENGNDTNYVKLRDVAYVLNGSAAQFSVGWDQAAGSISAVSGEAYKPNGTEMSTPFSGNRSYKVSDSPLFINGQSASLEAIVLTDDAGNGYTYFKLRDLGAALGFTVGWSEEKGIFIETK